ncbi:CHAT domain-containing protein [Zavarzinia compransoris]|uniref:CHAT domain-containing protein n=1 Tax=Zavarzinia compransoris TaxID=1264899 RepID=UPI00105F485E|nr:CHAT domain-containing protein [Zavarzinia compransoris]TDP49000.1 CHAT domain-containing protein [Zavarzinia compransoris]
MPPSGSRREDPADIQDLLRRLFERRDAGGLTAATAEALIDEARHVTAGAVDDPARRDRALRDLRRVLYTVCFDAGALDRAKAMVDLARPPGLDEAQPLAFPAGLSDDDLREWIKWYSARARLLETDGQFDQAREIHSALADACGLISALDQDLFFVLTNAVQSAYELGDYSRGRHLMAWAEAEAETWPTDEVKVQMAVTRLFPPLETGDLALLLRRHDIIRSMMTGPWSPLLPQVDRFVALTCLQLDAPAEAAARLGREPPPETAGPGERSRDALVRLQIQIAANDIDPVLVDQALHLLGCQESRPNDWAMLGALAVALFKLGRVGPAVLTATLFLRRLDSVAATLPRNPHDARLRRTMILSALEPLQQALVAADYLRGAEDVAGLHAMMLHGASLRSRQYRDWAPGPRIAAAAAAAWAAAEAARGGQADGAAFYCAVMAFDLEPAFPALNPAAASGLCVSFLPRDGRLLRIVYEPDGPRQSVVALAPDALAGLVQRLALEIRLHRDATAERAALGEALFGPLAARVRDAASLNIAPFGPVAGLPFAALLLDGIPLGTGRGLTIRTCGHPAAPVAGQGPRRGVCILSSPGADDAPLGRVDDEALAVAALHGVPAQAVIRDFDRAALDAALRDRPALLHIAAHFRLKEDDLAASCLIGAKGEAIPLETAFGARDLDGIDLVFLSGCGSAGHGGGRSLAGLLTALGVRYVIATLWPVDDEAAARMAVLIHGALVRGQPPDLALADAAAVLNLVPAFAAPCHWAAFQCYQA